jgi:hypothetical protein
MAVLDRFGVKKFFKTKPGSVNFYAAWNTTRTINTNGEDTVDPRLQVTCNANPLRIGGGMAQWVEPQSSARMYVNRGSATSQWLNTEQTIYIFNPSETPSRSYQLRFRANHHGADNMPYDKVGDVSCGFGNYLIKFGENLGDNLVTIEEEYIHGMYKRHIKDVTFTMPQEKWIGLKGICRNTDATHIRLTGYVNLNVSSQENWRKIIEFTFHPGETDSDITQATFDSELSGGGGDDRIPICLTGTPVGDGIVQSTRAGMISKKIFNRPGYWNWFRVENCENFKMKYYTVREIMPKNPFNPAII